MPLLTQFISHNALLSEFQLARSTGLTGSQPHNSIWLHSLYVTWPGLLKLAQAVNAILLINAIIARLLMLSLTLTILVSITIAYRFPSRVKVTRHCMPVHGINFLSRAAEQYLQSPAVCAVVPFAMQSFRLCRVMHRAQDRIVNRSHCRLGIWLERQPTGLMTSPQCHPMVAHNRQPCKITAACRVI